MLPVIGEGIEYMEEGKSANFEKGTLLSQEQKNKASYSHKGFDSLTDSAINVRGKYSTCTSWQHDARLWVWSVPCRPWH